MHGVGTSFAPVSARNVFAPDRPEVRRRLHALFVEADFRAGRVIVSTGRYSSSNPCLQHRKSMLPRLILPLPRKSLGNNRRSRNTSVIGVMYLKVATLPSRIISVSLPAASLKRRRSELRGSR